MGAVVDGVAGGMQHCAGAASPRRMVPQPSVEQRVGYGAQRDSATGVVAPETNLRVPPAPFLRCGIDAVWRELRGGMVCRETLHRRLQTLVKQARVPAHPFSCWGASQEWPP